MSGYFGTDAQRRLQMQAEASAGFINTTPGACQTGRTMGCDDPDALGWDQIDAFIQRDGVCGFRLIPREKTRALEAHLAKQNCRFDTWDVFLADKDTALAASTALISRALPDELIDLDPPIDADGDYVSRIQATMGTAGVAPFSGSFLVGAVGPATTVAIGTDTADIAAAAHGYMPHNAHSPYRHFAWGGLVAVAEAHRGKGLGNSINARMILSVFRDLDATHIYELVSASNVPSRRMVQACGLRHQPDLVCGVAIAQDAARLTR